MKGRIFVHVGLPKTATTTLQSDFFPVIAGNDIHYLGTYQPRRVSQQDLYAEICGAVNGESPIAVVQMALRHKLDSGETLIVSEEMFTVSQAGASWRVKIRNLAELLNGLDHVLILTVREPTAALFSYYVELNEKFLRQKKGFLELAKSDERMQIFHYQKLTDEIFHHFDRERVFVKQFEDIVVGQLDDLCHLITCGRRGWHGAEPKKHNEKKQTGNVVYTGKQFTLADIARRLAISLGIIEKGFFVKMKKTLRPVVHYLDCVAMFKKKVARPSREEIGRLKAYLKDETSALDRHFGIKYE